MHPDTRHALSVYCIIYAMLLTEQRKMEQEPMQKLTTRSMVTVSFW